MAANPLLEKLDWIQTRFEEVAQLITQSDVMSDMKRYAKLGKEYKDANGLKKVRLEDDEIEKIVTTFRKAKAVEDFSVVVTYSEVKEKGYSLSAGQYFDIKIDYVDITADEFNAQMKADTEELAAMFAESHKLEKEIQKQLASLSFGD